MGKEAVKKERSVIEKKIMIRLAEWMEREKLLTPDEKRKLQILIEKEEMIP